MIYVFNLLVWLKMMSPILLRKPKMVAYVYALLAGNRQIYDEFFLFRKNILEELSYNSQTKILTDLLNFKFAQTGIWIENINNTAPPTYIYDIGEGFNPYIYDLGEDVNPYIYDLEDINFTGVNFTIHVPIAFLNATTPSPAELIIIARINAIVAKYAFVGMDWRIEN